jgi:phosphate uptake regulator
MFTDTISAIETQNTDLIKGLTRRTQDIKRLFLVTNRLLRSAILFPTPSQNDGITLIDCVDYLQILHATSEVTGNLNKLAETINSLTNPKLPSAILKNLVETSTTIKQMYDSSVQALLSKDILLANKILDTSLELEKLWKLCLKANKESKISSVTLADLRLIIDSLEKTKKHTHEIANISIDRAEAVNARTFLRDPTAKTIAKKKQTL